MVILHAVKIIQTTAAELLLDGLDADTNCNHAQGLRPRFFSEYERD